MIGHRFPTNLQRCAKKRQRFPDDPQRFQRFRVPRFWSAVTRRSFWISAAAEHRTAVNFATDPPGTAIILPEPKAPAHEPVNNQFALIASQSDENSPHSKAQGIFPRFFNDSRRSAKDFPRISKGARKSAKDSPKILKDSKDFARRIFGVL